MKNIGIVVLCTNSYFVLGVRFIKRFMQYYKGDYNITFYFFSDTDPTDYLPDNIDVEYFYTTNNSWVDGTNLKFSSILSIGDRLKSDYIFYFDADTNVNNDFTEEWFLGDSVAGQHYGDQSWMKDKKGYERNPRSKAYVPEDTKLEQFYFYGAMWGFSALNAIEFCKTMLEWQLADKEWGYEPSVNDESFSNCYFHYNPPTKVVYCKDFAFAISDKGGIGETRRMDLDVSKIKDGLLLNKNNNINIQNGILTHE